MASMCEKKTIPSRPGIYHQSISDNSIPVWSQWLSSPEKRQMNAMNRRVMERLIRREEEAMTVFSPCVPLALTYRIWAFFRRPLLVVSKIEVTTRKSAQTPICGLDRWRISTIRLINPNSVMEKRCKMV